MKLYLFRTWICTIALSLLYIATLSAQSSGWQYLPNIGLPSFSRFEDIFFTDTLTGYAVGLGNVSPYYTQKNIFKTTDGGNNWNKIGPYVLGSNALRSIEFLNDKLTGIAGSLGGSIYLTNDAGVSWANISARISDTVSTDTLDSGHRNICGLSHFGNNFFGVGWYGAAVGRFYKSTDKGVTWSTTYIDTNLASSLVDVVFLSSDTGFITGGRDFYGGSWGAYSDQSVILKTTDGGATWAKVFSDTTIGGRIWKIQFIDRMNAVASIEPYYYPDSVNMVKSSDGGDTWTTIHVGSSHDTSIHMAACLTQGVGFATTKTGWLGGYYNGLFQTTDGGITWDTLQFGTNFNRIFVIDSAHVFAGGKSVYRWAPAPDTANNGISPLPLGPPHNLHSVMPNPASGNIKIEFNILTETNVLLQVANVDTRRHYPVARGIFKPGHYTYFWDGTNMPPGNYLVWLGTDQIPLTQKFVLVQ